MVAAAEERVVHQLPWHEVGHQGVRADKTARVFLACTTFKEQSHGGAAY